MTPVGGAAGLGTFADGVVVNERAAVAVRSDLPPEQLATIGCAVTTGAGSAINLAAIGPGDSVLVIGAGGIGLSGIQGARLQGALPIVALDPAAASRDVAIACGATHVFDPNADAVDEALMELTSGIGFDTVLDCVGSSATLDRAWAMSRRGGTIVEIGVPGPRFRSTALRPRDHGGWLDPREHGRDAASVPECGLLGWCAVRAVAQFG